MDKYDFAFDLKEKGMEVEKDWWIVYTSGLKYHIRHQHDDEKWMFLALRGITAFRTEEGRKLWMCEWCQARVPDAALGMLSMARWEEECGS